MGRPLKYITAEDPDIIPLLFEWFQWREGLAEGRGVMSSCAVIREDPFDLIPGYITGIRGTAPVRCGRTEVFNQAVLDLDRDDQKLLVRFCQTPRKRDGGVDWKTFLKRYHLSERSFIDVILRLQEQCRHRGL
jgi:hypothetical protein